MPVARYSVEEAYERHGSADEDDQSACALHQKDEQRDSRLHLGCPPLPAHVVVTSLPLSRRRTGPGVSADRAAQDDPRGNLDLLGWEGERFYAYYG